MKQSWPGRISITLVAAAVAMSAAAVVVADEQHEHPSKGACAVCTERATHGGEPRMEGVAGVSHCQGEHYYFCSKTCKATFDENPAWWLPMELPMALPELRVRTIDGGTAKIAKSDAGAMVIDFWATWCKPCQKVMKRLQELSDKEGKRGLRVVGVAIDEDDDAFVKVGNFLDKHEIRYPNYVDDPTDSAWVELKVRSVPTTLLIDGDGQIVHKWHGKVDHKELASKVDALLAAVVPSD